MVDILTDSVRSQVYIEAHYNINEYHEELLVHIHQIKIHGYWILTYQNLCVILGTFVIFIALSKVSNVSASDH